MAVGGLEGVRRVGRTMRRRLLPDDDRAIDRRARLARAVEHVRPVRGLAERRVVMEADEEPRRHRALGQDEGLLHLRPVLRQRELDRRDGEGRAHPKTEHDEEPTHTGEGTSLREAGSGATQSSCQTSPRMIRVSAPFAGFSWDSKGLPRLPTAVVCASTLEPA